MAILTESTTFDFKAGEIYGGTPATQWAANVAFPDGPDLGNRYWNTFEISARETHIT